MNHLKDKIKFFWVVLAISTFSGCAVDLYGTNNGLNGLVSSFLGLFSGPVYIARTQNPHYITAGDLNKDGINDLVVTSTTGGNYATVLLANGSGGFAKSYSYTVGTNPREVVIADFVKDGNPDIAVANYSSGTISLYQGDGTGAMTSLGTIAAGTAPWSITSGDLDGDGDPDLVSTDRSAGDVYVHIGDGLGGFASTSYAVTASPVSVIVGQFNPDTDSFQDVAVLPLGGNVDILLGDGAGSLGTVNSYGIGTNPQAITNGDVDGDGKEDIVASGYSGTLNWIIADGTGGFGTASSLAVTGEHHILDLADFDGDGDLDVAMASRTSSTTFAHVSLVLGDGAGNFTLSDQFQVGMQPKGLVVADLDADGDVDVAVASDTSSGYISVLKGDGAAGLSGETGTDLLYATTGATPSGVASADLNGDGYDDVVTVNNTGNNVTVFIANGSGGLSAGVDYTNAGSLNPYRVTLADFDNDSDKDMVVSFTNSNSIVVWLNDGTGGFASATEYAVGTSPREIAAADFNEDGSLDLAVANYSSNNFSILINDNDDTGNFGAAANTAAAGNGCWGVAAKDYDGDGNLDLAISNASSNNIGIHLGDGAGNFGVGTTFATGSVPRGIESADFDGDGDYDIAANLGITQGVSILINNGSASFGVTAVSGDGLSGIDLDMGDYDEDGDMDLAVADNGSGTVSIYAGDGSGGFTYAYSFGALLTPRGVASGDIDGDGHLDMAVTNGGSDNLGIYLGY